METESQSPAPPLVEPAWLAGRLEDPGVVVLDTRGRVPAPGAAPEPMLDAFEAGHIPGAGFVVWNRDFIDAGDPVPNQLAGATQFAAAAAALGIDAGTHVVAYDDYHSIFAGRLWWAFRAMGHDRISVLDGGLAGWRAAGLAIETGRARVRTPRADHPPLAAAPRPELRWSIDQVAGRAPGTVLVDARSPERFAGEGGDPVGGHVPGAVNVPYAALVGDDGFLRPPAELRAAFAAAGIDASDPPAQLVASCGSGISASVPLLALETLTPGAGAGGAVYDGSWSEWSRSGRPIATGPA